MEFSLNCDEDKGSVNMLQYEKERYGRKETCYKGKIHLVRAFITY